MTSAHVGSQMANALLRDELAGTRQLRAAMRPLLPSAYCINARSHPMGAVVARAALLAGVAFVGLLVGACDVRARTLEQIRAEGTLRIGVNPNFPAHSFYGRKNELEGFDIDVGNRLAKALGVKPEFVPTETALRVPFLSADRIDISLGALTRTPEREKLIDFTIPLHTEAMGVLTTEKLNIQSWRDLDKPSITLVNMRGNSTVPFIQKSLPHARLLLVDTNADTVRTIAQGRADAMVENVAFFVIFTKAYPHVRWRILSEPIQVAYCGVGVAKGNTELRQELNSVLAELHRKGYINYEWKKWYSWPMQGTIDVDAELARAAAGSPAPAPAREKAGLPSQHSARKEDGVSASH
jgi:polar amino acid transport system substrate-binding protein